MLTETEETALARDFDLQGFKILRAGKGDNRPA